MKLGRRPLKEKRHRYIKDVDLLPVDVLDFG
jgi:hypothetical protein